MRKQGKLNLQKKNKGLEYQHYTLSIFQTQIFKVNFVGPEPIWVIDMVISLYTLPT